MTDPVFYRAGGCDACLKRGLSGGVASTSSWSWMTRVGSLILQSADAQAIKRAAVSSGMETMRDDGARKVLRGTTTVEEVLAATQEDFFLDE